MAFFMFGCFFLLLVYLKFLLGIDFGLCKMVLSLVSFQMIIRFFLLKLIDMVNHIDYFQMLNQPCILMINLTLLTVLIYYHFYILLYLI